MFNLPKMMSNKKYIYIYIYILRCWFGPQKKKKIIIVVSNFSFFLFNKRKSTSLQINVAAVNTYSIIYFMLTLHNTILSFFQMLQLLQLQHGFASDALDIFVHRSYSTVLWFFLCTLYSTGTNLHMDLLMMIIG